MHFFDILCFDVLLFYQTAEIPESNESHLCFEVETDSQFNLFTDRDTMNTKAQIIEGDFAIGVDGSLEPITKNIIQC